MKKSQISTKNIHAKIAARQDPDIGRSLSEAILLRNRI